MCLGVFGVCEVGWGALAYTHLSVRHLQLERDLKAKDQSVSSVAQSCPTLCDPMDGSTPGFPVHHQLLELDQIHVHRVGNAI